MKKITLALLLLSSFTFLFAQAPQKMSYQSVVRKTDGTLVAGTLISIKTSILLGSTSGTASYVETQTTTTNSNGLATIEIGGGTPTKGTFSGINWGAGSHFIKTEIDPTGGTNYTISGTSQLLSVPYALYAGSTENKGKATIFIGGDITDAQAAAQIQAEFGPHTEKIYVTRTTNLTTLDLSMVKSIFYLNISFNSKLVTVKFDNLSVVQDEFDIKYNEKLSSIVFPVLEAILGDDQAIIYDNKSLVSISVPRLTQFNDLSFSYNSSLNSIDIPMLSLSTGRGIGFSANALPSSQVNSLLNKLKDVLPASRKSIQLQGQNPPAPPTGQGIIDKATLINTGNFVTTD
ncbi:hypothetical protein [Flavobacterium collinsii]|uniref:Legionella vir region protein n=1 Tax=Flavobacterium collinsii TaxID=1114861 RepID=A0A9W4TIE1_9FLAO|nr:hypothetical protein [Flavobacterium collinsii]CAI2767817.1 Legionella vir region protein [Flavobacterium collinsii]